MKRNLPCLSKSLEWVSTITPSIQHCTGGPKQCNKARKRNKRFKNWTATSKTIFICRWQDYIEENEQIIRIKNKFRASLVAQWLRIHLPMQGTRVQALVQEDPTWRGATKPMCHNYWVCPLEPMSHNYWAHMPQLLKPTCLEPMIHNKRSHHNEKPAHHNEE